MNPRKYCDITVDGSHTVDGRNSKQPPLDVQNPIIYGDGETIHLNWFSRRISEPSTVCFREDIKAALDFSIHSIATISQDPGRAAIIFALVPPFFRQPFRGGKKPGKNLTVNQLPFTNKNTGNITKKDAKHANFDKKQPNKNTYKHLQNSSTNNNVMLQLLLFLNMENSDDFELRLGVEQNSWLSSIQSASAEGSCLAHVVTFSKPRSPKMCWVRMGKVCHQNLLRQISYFTNSFQKKHIHRTSNTVKHQKKTSVNLVKSFNFELVGVELPIPKKCLKKLSFNFLHPYHPWDKCIFTYIDPIKINHSCRCIYIYIHGSLMGHEKKNETTSTSPKH